MKNCCWILITLLCLPGLVHAQGKDKDGKELITKDAQKAIDSGLAYLAKEQAKDGSWGTDNFKGNVGVTSLAGLALLSGGHHPGRGDHGKAVTQALRYILDGESKDIAGLFVSKGGFQTSPMYGHGFAVLFLADAYANVPDKKLKTEVKEALERAVKLIVASQNKEGGWRYSPKPIDADLSVTAVQVVALCAARDAGFEVPKATFDKAVKYVKSCQDKDGGGFRYQAFAGGPVGFARTGAGLTSLNRLGVPDDEVAKKGMGFLGRLGPKKKDDAIHYYYGQYYAAKAKWHAGDKDFQKWYPTVRDELVKNQKEDRWTEPVMCPHYCTAMALIILQMPNGHLPSMKRGK